MKEKDGSLQSEEVREGGGDESVRQGSLESSCFVSPQ